MNRFLVSTSLILAMASLGACSSDESGDDDPGDAAASSSGAATSSSSSSSGSSVLNGCTTFVDKSTDTAVEIAWINPMRADRCVKVKAGTKVTWKGDMVAHPLAQQGGDSGSPIAATSTGVDAAFTFAAEGDFGYVCTKHGNMQGVVQVVP